VASAPAGNDFENQKKSKKKDKRSSGSFFGLFGSKSEVSAREESPKVVKDDFEETKKKSKKSKRSSVPDGLGLYGDVGAQSVSDLARISSNGNGHSNGSHEYDEVEASEGQVPKKESFLAKAGTLGAGAGLAGAAVAIAAQYHQRSKADKAKSHETSERALHDSSIESQQQRDLFDPEIAQRQFRPSIDPQYGDLLPLPPSDPASPSIESIDELPGLPDSRPNTPEAERVAREKPRTQLARFCKSQP